MKIVRTIAKIILWLPLYFSGWVLVVCGFEKKYARIMEDSQKENAAKPSLLNRLLVRCFNFYYFRKNKSVFGDRPTDLSAEENKKFQQEFWSNNTLYYHRSAIKNFDNDFHQKYDEMFASIVKDDSVKVVMEMGCGSFINILRLQEKHEGLEFIGVDISDYSKELFEKTISKKEGIQFLFGSLTDNLESLNNIDLFFSTSSLMYLSADELKAFLKAFASADRKIQMLITEPVIENEDVLSRDYPDHSFRHDYRAYFKEYGIKVVESFTIPHWNYKDLNMIFARVVNKGG